MKQTPVRVLSDDEIIELYWERNENAIKHTDVKYRAYLMKVANNILHDLQDSEECLNDTYLSAWNTIPPERPYLLKAYLTAIIRNLSLMTFRKQNAHKRAAQSQAVSLSELEDVLADCNDTNHEHMLAIAIEEFIASLDAQQRYIFLSRYYFGKSIDDVASEMGVSRSKISKQIAQIKQALKQKLTEEGIGL